MKVIKILLSFTALFILIFIVFIVYFTLTDYKPAEKIEIFDSKVPDTLSIYSIYSVISWNIGYCGLNAQMDFFYDGGKKVYPEYSVVLNNLKNIIKQLKDFTENNDFILLQEVDINSRRSYFINQVSEIQQALNKKMEIMFALNYKVNFVPVPVSKPMGKVESGISILTKYKPLKAYRISLPSDYPWPKKLFMLDRCCLIAYIPVNNNRYFVMINTHNSAYDDGSLRMLQNQKLKNLVLEEYSKGNYVLIGGDWNQIPSDFKPQYLDEIYDSTYYSMSIPDTFPDKEWKVCYDNKIPSNRSTAISYVKGKTPVTTIDFFIVSPNIEVINIENINLNFKFSDHNPVKLMFRLL